MAGHRDESILKREHQAKVGTRSTEVQDQHILVSGWALRERHGLGTVALLQGSRPSSLHLYRVEV